MFAEVIKAERTRFLLTPKRTAMIPARRAIEAIWHIESARLVAGLVRLTP